MKAPIHNLLRHRYLEWIYWRLDLLPPRDYLTLSSMKSPIKIGNILEYVLSVLLLGKKKNA